MDCMTVLCCVNLSMDDKHPLLIIEKSIKPCCFKGVDVDKLPVVYWANTNAWMTGVLFEEWVCQLDKLAKEKQWDKQLREKIVLFVDNCTAHLQLTNLKNIQLEFLSKNTTSLIQPMDQGAIRNFKHFY